MALPAFVFNDGAKDVQTTSDPNELYKGVIERALRARWNRPEEVRDENYAADIELRLDKTGATRRLLAEHYQAVATLCGATVLLERGAGDRPPPSGGACGPGRRLRNDTA